MIDAQGSARAPSAPVASIAARRREHGGQQPVPLGVAVLFAALLAACDRGTVEPSNDLGAVGLSNGGTTVAEDGGASIVTFTRAAAAIDAEPTQGRLPADGDRTIYVAATELFPGMARIDAGIANPYAGDREAIAAGERHFAAFNCAGCHAPLGGGGMGPPLSDSAWIYGSEPAQIYLSIMHGRPAGMPAWSSMLPRKVVWELAAYIETLDDIDDYAAELGFEAHDPPGTGDRDAASGDAATGDATADRPATSNGATDGAATSNGTTDGAGR